MHKKLNPDLGPTPQKSFKVFSLQRYAFHLPTGTIDLAVVVVFFTPDSVNLEKLLF